MEREIRVSTVPWNPSKALISDVGSGVLGRDDEKVDIEVWDVVDGDDDDDDDTTVDNKNDDDNKIAGLKSTITSISSSADSTKLARLTTSVVDVYKNSHGCVFLLDPRKTGDLTYIKENILDVPLLCPILVVLNFRDATDDVPSALSLNTVTAALQPLAASRHLTVTEASMLNCFGLRRIHEWCSIPLLALRT